MNTENQSPRLNPKHEIFIQQMLRHGNKLRAYKAAYPKATDEAARTASSRLMKNTHIKEKLADIHNEIHIGLKEDKMAFIHQELKIIDQKRKLLVQVISGGRIATVSELLRAIRLDNELAEQQAMLLGYGSLKPEQKKNAEIGTKMNNKHIPQPAEPTPATDNNWNSEGYTNNLPGLVTNTTYTCNPSPAIASAKEGHSPAVASAKEDTDQPQYLRDLSLDHLMRLYGLEPPKTGKLFFK